jgi:hypothetical protein
MSLPPVSERTFEWYINQHRRGKGYKEPPDGLAELLWTLSFIPADYKLPDMAAEFNDYLSEPDHFDAAIETRILHTFTSLPEGFASLMTLPVLARDYETAKRLANEPRPDAYSFIATPRIQAQGLTEWPNYRSIYPTKAQTVFEWLYTLEPSKIKDMTREQVDSYSYYREAREILLSLIKRNKSKLDQTQFREGLFASPIRISGCITVDENGRIQLVFGTLARMLDGAEVERIRQCKMCHEIFWAGRLDQETCTRRCTNLFHQHKRRYQTDDEKLAYKMRRIEREQKKASQVNSVEVVLSPKVGKPQIASE